MATELDDLRQRLEAISDELGDLALDRLRAALDGAGGDPAGEERRLTRARRAVDKATALLRQADEV
ncbi:MAG: hypothetical protein CYG61_04415 [Actinobacteria bacterium]|nr:MAG: hypothetical protein CYG61_04415 [Actinomycetota bacterium]